MYLLIQHHLPCRDYMYACGLQCRNSIKIVTNRAVGMAKGEIKIIKMYYIAFTSYSAFSSFSFNLRN